MSVSIKVAVRCRPFTIDDKLGVHMVQNSEEEGEINLLNSDYSTNRFAFTYAWWSAYGYERRLQSNQTEANAMHLMNQEEVYSQCGSKIKGDLLEGNAVVLFAYGLSGSGKTFTVFGPDAPDIPEAWFKHSEPHALWGIFPRLAYELFAMKTDGWKITMKYFQNVVDTVRDLMSPMGEEKQYKNGMRKDADGFMDIEWCSSKVLQSWDDLRHCFMDANSRKAIAPTQFNHQSTRGHCIMTLEVEMPNPDNPELKQIGRVYICDLAGTEPAGDIVYAKYEKKVFPNGDIEHNFVGAHDDPRKTKELQSQGMKINLSLTEMAQFFMKMAEAVKKKKLKPGMSIPGCNSYFLCKFLKDTMLQARTYLFCAVRPEVKYLNYTFSTLGFAKNASVVKLQPKKAMVCASDAERKLMQELDQMKAMFAQLMEENEKLKGSTGGGEDDGNVSLLQQMLAAKQAELQSIIESGGNSGGQGGTEARGDPEATLMAQQRDEYGRRGIHLSYFEKDTQLAHFINLDEDPFRSKRFMYMLVNPVTVFGPDGDIKPLALTVVRDHCRVTTDEDGSLRLCGGKGETYHNGELLAEGKDVVLAQYDRVAIGGELLLFVNPMLSADGEEGEVPTAEWAVEELQVALQAKDHQAERMLAQRMAEFEEEKQRWAVQRERAEAAGEEFDELEPIMNAEKERAWEMVDREILDLLPKTKEAKNIVRLMDRDVLTFDVALQRVEEGLGTPKVKIKVELGSGGLDGEQGNNNSILLDPMDFMRGFSVLKDELTHLRTAKDNGREYTVDEHHDPIRLLFDNTFKFGTSVVFPEFMLYGLETDADECAVDIKAISSSYDNVGALEIDWTPITEETDEELVTMSINDDIDDPQQLLGKPWAYRVTIKSATILPIMVSSCFVQYEFFGQLYTTETVEANTHRPVLDYTFVHSVEHVTPAFIEFLQLPMQYNVWISPFTEVPKTPVSTSNARVLAARGNGDGAGRPLSPSAVCIAEGSAALDVAQHKQQQEMELSLRNDLKQAQQRIAELESQVERLTQELQEAQAQIGGGLPAELSASLSSPRARLAAAKQLADELAGPSDGDDTAVLDGA